MQRSGVWCPWEWRGLQAPPQPTTSMLTSRRKDHLPERNRSLRNTRGNLSTRWIISLHHPCCMVLIWNLGVDTPYHHGRSMAWCTQDWWGDQISRVVPLESYIASEPEWYPWHCLCVLNFFPLFLTLDPAPSPNSSIFPRPRCCSPVPTICYISLNSLLSTGKGQSYTKLRFYLGCQWVSPNKTRAPCG